MTLEIVENKNSQYEKVLDCLEDFDPISLNEMNKVKLMDRFDTKYWFPVEKLPEILKEVQDSYFVLEIGSERIQQYKTIYYDTPDNNLYVSHHNGRLNRIKIRKRQYVNSGINFLEIKKKNNKGKTNKLRIPIDSFDETLYHNEVEFIDAQIQLPEKGLVQGIKNTFSRITFVHRDFSERCTIDLNLSFVYNGVKTKLKRMVIVELKRERSKSISPLEKTLKENRIYKDGFSKYCIGRALLQPGIKQNQFKPKLLRIKRDYLNN